MPRKATDGTFKPNQKEFLKLMQKRDTIQKTIDRNMRKRSKVDAQLSKYATWLQTLTAKQ
jgi:hypothetical protein